MGKTAEFEGCGKLTTNTTYEKILDAADYPRRENCSFIRLNDTFRKTLLKAAKKALRQPTVRAEFSLIRPLISN